ncbi:unnamed protein product [Angiostrongylus costaricensis]|uniref:G protein-coupled receptor n=1 Tax=Angiostrongylus costaricensis TaxID=334426 RepID=A0A0R3PCW2_ANGCS|nr:unnamed protein product [Angiostrongylus costaricensis]
MPSVIVQSGLSSINSYVFGVISISLNSFLIYVIRNRPSRVIGSYKQLMVACAGFDICFSAVYITFAATPEMSALLIVNGGIEMPTICGRVLLVIFVLLFCQSLIIPPSMFVFRYLQICSSTVAITSCETSKLYPPPPVSEEVGFSVISQWKS